MNIDKDGDRRCYEAKNGRNGKRHLANIEVGFRHDVDLRSCVQTEGAQEFIRQNYKDIIGARVRLEKDNHVGEYVIYRIVLVSSDIEIGNTSRQFYDSMVRAIKTIYKLPSGKTPYFKVFPDRICDIYVEDIISVVDRADGSETGGKSFGEMVTWNAVNIVGYGTAEYI
ncbi:MAG: hypothetical protein K2O54_05360 [Prevotella sp.]|nr:hypothetical protein [Prevotella sp.]